MQKKIFMCLLIVMVAISPATYADTKSVEIFHIEKGKVIKEVPYNEKIHNVTTKMLNNISGVYTNITPLPKKGYMFKLPIEPPIQVDNRWYSDFADEVIVIFSPDEKQPYLLLWDDENQPHFLTTDFDEQELFQSLKYYPSLN